MISYLLKRPFDFTLSLVGLVTSLPLLAIFGFLIWLEDRRPVFHNLVYKKSKSTVRYKNYLSIFFKISYIKVG